MRGGDVELKPDGDTGLKNWMPSCGGRGAKEGFQQGSSKVQSALYNAPLMVM